MSSRRYASRVICARYVTSRYHTLSVIFILKSAVTAPYIIFIPKFISPPPPATPGRRRCFPRQPCPCLRSGVSRDLTSPKLSNKLI